ncbi:Poly(A) polymerase gamma [Thecamonas trahens ATCC 50062]|uniref:Poly(A) polymerase n=1 Tax=Thecamonas trahens ATCC 50062 TaxID=461836 RepID=A0A0L0DEY3_THETB|nr:Poly(A) polymerase gamma [Thecamonas trahens ATCC 50062]KNC50785.1 Poly(A) polymerase gamma [Thecamonas trahens ATCC 50062]|eukprot:XP_013756744.1 Poly(A) polymerase gamma [Thecamonas trahens ATCC 50062]
MSLQWGVTPPLTLDTATEGEKALSRALREELVARGQFEPEAHARLRQKVIGKLNKMVKDWVKETLLAKKQPPSVAASAGGKIFAYGSYRLGVCTESSDIDTLCVLPRDATVDDFFKTFKARLEARPEVTELVAVREAVVPIIKIVFATIQIDLIVASLSMSAIPDTLQLDNDMVLQGMTDSGARTLNGSRVTDKILKVIPDPAPFRLVLRAIRLWSKSRLLYGFLKGFFNGITLAILVARVCQLVPYGAPAKIISMFFKLFKEWNFRKNPIRLVPAQDSMLGLTQWDPTNYRDRGHLMPVLTPAYPSLNANTNITRSTIEIIRAEFERGEEIVNAVYAGQASWGKLFEPPRFFKMYRTFFMITAYAATPEAMGVWHGYVESRLLRDFVMKLENELQIEAVHPYTKEFENVIPGEDRQNCVFFVGVQFAEDLLKRRNKRIDLGAPAFAFQKRLSEWPDRSSDMTIDILPLKRKDLPPFVKELMKARRKAEKSAAKAAAAATAAVAAPPAIAAQPPPAPKRPLDEAPAAAPAKKQKMLE